MCMFDACDYRELPRLTESEPTAYIKSPPTTGDAPTSLSNHHPLPSNHGPSYSPHSTLLTRSASPTCGRRRCYEWRGRWAASGGRWKPRYGASIPSERPRFRTVPPQRLDSRGSCRPYLRHAPHVCSLPSRDHRYR